MHHIKIKASPNQLSKLRNGHKVRIVKGEGCNLIVHPETYSIVSRAFAKNNGVNVQSNPQELAINKQYSYLSPEEHRKQQEAVPAMADIPPAMGKGIYKCKGGKLTGAIKALDKIGQTVAPKILDKVVDKGIDYALGGSIKGCGKKSILDFLIDLGAKHGEKAVEKYISEGGRINGRGNIHDTLGKMVKGLTIAGRPIERVTGVNPYDVANPIAEYIAPEIEKGLYGGPEGNPWRGAGIRRGKGYGISAKEALHQSGLGNLSANQIYDKLEEASIYGRRQLEPYHHYITDALGPRSRGQGTQHSQGSPNFGGRQSILHNGYQPPALISQPLSANFQMQHFLPPQYQQHFFTGGGLYT
jgi:hypothetical protein